MVKTLNERSHNRELKFPPEDLQKNCLKYIYWYSSIENLTSNEGVNGKYKNITKDIRKVIPNRTIVILTKASLNEEKNTEFDFSKDKIYCTVWNGCSQVVALLRHLRNSIAHGSFVQEGKNMKIIDVDNNGLLTGVGQFKTKVIKDLLNLCIKRVENN